MTVAAIGDVAYRAVLVAHFIFVIAGAGMAWLAPLFITRARRVGGRHIEDFAVETANAVVFPALLLAGVAGGALVGLSDNVYDFEQLWLSIAGGLWILSLVCAAVCYPPRWLNIVNAAEDRRRIARIVLHIALLLMLIVMTWKDSISF